MCATNEGPPIDWDAFEDALKNGPQFMELLVKLPRERWAERDRFSRTLLHFACMCPDVAAAVALLTSGLVDVNARDKWGHTPAHYAASYKKSRVLEVLCAAGADLRARNENGHAPIDRALWNAAKDGGETARVLVANGARLSTVCEGYRHYITPELVVFERGVLRCRAAVVAMLRVKKAANLYHVDKFLMRELAFAMWATRTCDEWQDK